jgi:hypothetical protein
VGHGCLRAPSSASTAAGPERNLSPVEFQEIAAGNPGFEKLRDENRNQRDSDEEAEGERIAKRRHHDMPFKVSGCCQRGKCERCTSRNCTWPCDRAP